MCRVLTVMVASFLILAGGEGAMAKPPARPPPKAAARKTPATKLAPFDLRAAVRSWFNSSGEKRASIAADIARHAGAEQVRQAIGRLEPVLAAKVAGGAHVTHHVQAGSYLVVLPRNYSHKRPWPLHIALHGKGAAQNSSLMCEKYWAGVPPAKGFILACPNLPGGDWKSETGERLVLETYRDALARYNVRANQVSLGGFSAGAIGTWHIAAKYPDLFAAVVARSGRWTEDAEIAKNFKALPVFATHGTADVNIGVEGTREAVKTLRQAGAWRKDSVYKEAKGVAHEFMTKLNAAALQWLAGKRRPTPREARVVEFVVAPDRKVKTVYFVEVESSVRQRVRAEVQGGNAVSIHLGAPAKVSKVTVFLNSHVGVDPAKPVTLRVNGRSFALSPKGDPALVLTSYDASRDLRRTFVTRHVVTRAQIADLPRTVAVRQPRPSAGRTP